LARSDLCVNRSLSTRLSWRETLCDRVCRKRKAALALALAEESFPNYSELIGFPLINLCLRAAHEWQTVSIPMLDFNARHELPTVLLVDDDMVSREVMATMLTMSGYAVHTADDGRGALAMLTAKACVPGVILMDAQMPGLSGAELIEQLRKNSQARLYIISASGLKDEIKSMADGFLQKPFQPEALTRMLQAQEEQLNPPTKPDLDPEETVINPATLARLREMMPEKAIRQIFEAIVADVARRITALEGAIGKADWTEVRRIGHAIKGGGSLAGASQVARLGDLIEEGAIEPSKGNQSDNSSVILANLRAAARNLQRMLDSELKV
jgi:CheY-like chemotaxis protein